MSSSDCCPPQYRTTPWHPRCRSVRRRRDADIRIATHRCGTSRRKCIATIAVTVFDGDRRQYRRNQCGSGIGGRDWIPQKISIDQIKTVLRELEATCETDIHHIDDQERSITLLTEIAERRSAEQAAIEALGI